MAQERKVIKEFDRDSWGGHYHVERQYHDWDWRFESQLGH